MISLYLDALQATRRVLAPFEILDLERGFDTLTEFKYLVQASQEVN
jgi:hypothetical protein